MRLVARFELAAKSRNKLDALFRETFNGLARSNPDGFKRRNALASLENIRAKRLLRGPGY